MTREQWMRALSILVRRGALATDEARQALAAFDAGAIPPDMLPLDAAAAFAAADADRRREAWLLLLLLLAVGRREVIRRLRPHQQRRVRELLAARFDETVTRVAARAASSVPNFQRGMADAVTLYALAQATAGAGRPLDDAQLGRVQAANRRNLAYLALFATQIAARHVLERPLSYEQVRSRARLYSGVGTEQYSRAQEDGLQRGWVVRYISRDDPATCSACGSYHNTLWLPGEGPYPGSVCYGRGRCRCERAPEYNPAEYERLTGGRP